MASVNKVIIVGNLGADPESRFTADGTAVTNIRVATTERRKDKNTGEMQEHTEWHRIVFYNRLAEVASEYLKKGRSVYVEGSLKTSKYTDKDGIERFSTEIRGKEMQILGSRPGEDAGGASGDKSGAQSGAQGGGSSRSTVPGRGGNKPANARQPAPKAQAAEPALEDDDIPF